MTGHKRGLLTVCIAGLAALPACAAQPPAPGAIAPPKRVLEAVETQPSPAGEPVNTASMPREVRKAVVADAARRFRVDENAVVITRAELWRRKTGQPLGAGVVTYSAGGRQLVVVGGGAVSGSWPVTGGSSRIVVFGLKKRGGPAGRRPLYI